MNYWHIDWFTQTPSGSPPGQKYKGNTDVLWQDWTISAIQSNYLMTLSFRKYRKYIIKCFCTVSWHSHSENIVSTLLKCLYTVSWHSHSGIIVSTVLKCLCTYFINHRRKSAFLNNNKFLYCLMTLSFRNYRKCIMKCFCTVSWHSHSENIVSALLNVSVLSHHTLIQKIS